MFLRFLTGLGFIALFFVAALLLSALALVGLLFLSLVRLRLWWQARSWRRAHGNQENSREVEIIEGEFRVEEPEDPRRKIP